MKAKIRSIACAVGVALILLVCGLAWFWAALALTRPQGVSWNQLVSKPAPKVVRVPSLHGDDVEVPEDQIDKITPLGWAMLLDLRPTERNQVLYRRACQANPELVSQVGDELAAKARFLALPKRHH